MTNLRKLSSDEELAAAMARVCLRMNDDDDDDDDGLGKKEMEKMEGELKNTKVEVVPTTKPITPVVSAIDNRVKEQVNNKEKEKDKLANTEPPKQPIPIPGHPSKTITMREQQRRKNINGSQSNVGHAKRSNARGESVNSSSGIKKQYSSPSGLVIVKTFNNNATINQTQQKTTSSTKPQDNTPKPPRRPTHQSSPTRSDQLWWRPTVSEKSSEGVNPSKVENVSSTESIFKKSLNAPEFYPSAISPIPEPQPQPQYYKPTKNYSRQYPQKSYNRQYPQPHPYQQQFYHPPPPPPPVAPVYPPQNMYYQHPYYDPNMVSGYYPPVQNGWVPATPSAKILPQDPNSVNKEKEDVLN